MYCNQGVFVSEPWLENYLVVCLTEAAKIRLTAVDVLVQECQAPLGIGPYKAYIKQFLSASC